MKNTLIILTAALSAFQGFALENKYSNKEDYTFKSIPVNTSAKEDGLSLYKEGVAYMGKDSARYKLTLPDSVGQLSDKTMVDSVLSAIHADGQFAYDVNSGLIYVSIEGVLYAVAFNNDQKNGLEKLQIDSVSGGREDFAEFSTLAYRRWRFRLPEIKGKIHNPNLSADGQKLYFSADFDGGKGGSDIWYITPKANGVWSAPVNVAEVNTENDEDYPFAYKDDTLYFSSNRKDTLDGWNVYKCKLDSAAVPVMLAEGVNSNGNDFNFVGNEKCIYVISDREGNQDIYSPMKIEKPVVVDTVPVDTTPVKEIKVVYPPVDSCVFYFQFNKDELVRNYDSEIKLVATIIMANPDKNYVVHGYTDARGTQQYNKNLSERRSQAIYNMLLKEGVPAAQLKYVGEGKSKLAVANAKDEDNHQMNRRVIIKTADEEK